MTPDADTRRSKARASTQYIPMARQQPTVRDPESRLPPTFAPTSGAATNEFLDRQRRLEIAKSGHQQEGHGSISKSSHARSRSHAAHGDARPSGLVQRARETDLPVAARVDA